MSQSANIEKYEFWGLVAFVGIPLPGTGAWTGALIAALLGIRFRKAFPAIVIGVCLAACIMTIILMESLGGYLVKLTAGKGGMNDADGTE